MPPRPSSRLAALGLVAAALVCATAAEAKAPEWDRKELRTFFAQIQNAARAPSVAVKDRALAQVAGGAYRVPEKAGEPTETYAKRILRKRVPDHPSVKQGQWLTALTRQLYLDLSDRCRLVARFERDREDRRYFQGMSEQTKQVAAQLAGQLELVVEGLDEVTEPLPAVGGEPSEDRGVMARVHDGGVITVQRLDRVRFQGHRPPPDRPRTAKGALKEVFGAQKQFNAFAKTIGKYDGAHARAHGHVQVIVPASYPAIYLNEIVRGGVEAGMHTLHLKTMTKRGELRELRVALRAPDSHRRRKKAPKLVPVSCEDAQPMSGCAKKLKHASLRGQPLYQVP